MSGGIIFGLLFRHLARGRVRHRFEKLFMTVSTTDVEGEACSWLKLSDMRRDGFVYTSSAKLPRLPRRSSKWPELPNTVVVR